jgi:hypothetical protein
MGAPQGRFRHFVNDKKLLTLPGIEKRFLGLPACGLVLN